MARLPRDAAKRAQKVIRAWEALRPTKSFAGMTLEEFKAKCQPGWDARKEIARLQSQLSAAMSLRDNADEETNATILLVVNAVRGDPAEGEDGELYGAMGYIRKSDRKVGLRHNNKPSPPQ
jgi:hypothetical protein